jgi:hypothetical protein
LTVSETGTVVEVNKVEWRCLDIIRRYIFMNDTSKPSGKTGQETTSIGLPLHFLPLLGRHRKGTVSKVLRFNPEQLEEAKSRGCVLELELEEGKS